MPIAEARGMTLRQLLLIALFTVAGGRAWAEESFSDHYDRAVAFAQNDQHSEALKELQAAYGIRQLPKLLYEMARAHHRLGNGKEAVEHYQRFLIADPTPDPAMKADAEAQLVALKRLLPPPIPVQPSFALPPGYAPDMRLAPIRYEWRHHRGMVGWGLALLNTAYAAALFTGISFTVIAGGSGSRNDPAGNIQAAGGTLIIPIAGPFISALVYRHVAWSLPFVLVDGAAQVAGLALTIVGARKKIKVPVLADNFRIAPYGTYDGGGLVVSGKF
jgi:hypothetical protein